MIVSRIPLKLLLWVVLAAVGPVTAAGIKCNTGFLNRFKLSGTGFSLYQPMKVCPNAGERCCSLSDEIRIQRFWTGHSKPLLDRLRDKCLHHMDRATRFFDFLARMDPQLIMVKYGLVRQVPYTAQDCHTLVGTINRTEIEQLQGYIRYSSQVEAKEIRAPDPFSNDWQSRNPAHAYWNLANWGTMYRVPRPVPNFSDLQSMDQYGNILPIPAHNGVQDPARFVQPPPFSSSLMDPSQQKADIPKAPPDRRARQLQGISSSRYTRRLQAGPSITRQAAKSFAASRDRLSGRRQSYRPTAFLKAPCRRRNRTFTKEFIIVNTAKANYCFNIYRGFLNFDVDMLRGYFPAVKAEMSAVHTIKQGLYCAVCDANMMSNFGFGTKTIFYDPGFCRQLLTAHGDYLRFINIVFIRFVDQILQYIQCFESNGQVFAFPFQNFLRKYIRRIPFWEKCFESLGGDTFNTACWSICNKWSILGVAPLFDGDLPLLERVSATIFSFLRKWRFEEDTYKPILGNRTDVDWQKENVFNLQATDNVNGLMIEPVHPGSFVTGDRYTPNDEFQKKFFDLDSPNAMNRQRQQEIAVNHLLRVARMGNWTRLNTYIVTPHLIRQVGGHVNQNLLANEDKQRSVVNGLLNQLYSLKTRQEVTPSLRQPRYLRREISSVLKEAGVDPGHYRRALHEYRWVGQNVTFNGTYKPRGRIHPSTHNRFDTYGKPVTYRNATLVLSPNAVEEENPLEFEIENNSPITEPISMHPGIDDFAYNTKEKGIHPIVLSYSSNYRFNVSRLIGMQYQSPEKLNHDVILAFMTANAQSINLFNEGVDETTLILKDLENEYPQSKTYNRIVWLKALVNIDKQYGLYKQLENKETDILEKQVTAANGAKKEEKKKKDYKKAVKEANQYRLEETLKISRDIHKGHGMFDELFQAIADLFIGLFGS